MNSPADAMPGAENGAHGSLFLTIAITYGALLLASGLQLLDPLVRHDDFPALLAEPSGFYIKTLHEGRWLNYWWHLRGLVTPAWLNYAVYQLFWAIFAGSVAVNACGRGEQRWYVVALALMIAVAPPALLISLWFNTLIPGLGLVALFAALATVLSPGRMRLLLLLFVPATLMAYTSYPLLLLAVCLTTRGAHRSWRDLIGLMALFIFSFALGIVLIYSLNYLEHGIFGIPMAEWRNPSPAHDMASLIANLDQVWAFLSKSADTLAFHFAPFVVAHGVILTGSLLIMARANPWLALYILTGLLAGLGLLCLQVILTGVEVPVRAILFVWVLYAILCVRVVLVACDMGERGKFGARMGRNVVVLIVASYLLQTGRQYFEYRTWQVETRALAVQVAAGTGPIYVAGSFESLAGAQAAGIQEPRGLRLRLTYLTGRVAYMCEETPAACAGLAPELLTDSNRQTPEVRTLPDRTVVLLPKASK